ncbi:MAG: class I SAM-dependent methyltransferase [Opitutaceae bacterium]
MSTDRPLRRLRRQWERNARLDPYWTILTREGRRHGRWDREEFFATGRGDVERHLDRLKAEGFRVGRGRALDFGCGLGRLTRPLAETFGSAVGVDLSARMVDLARELHAGVPGVSFVHNNRPDLGAFASGSFDFVYSLITLQHMPPPLARGYLAEMIRVCEPGGLVLVQVMTRRRRGGGWWPPSLAKRACRALNGRLALAPVIAMFTVPESEAREIAAGAGGELAAVWSEEPVEGNFESRVLVVRPKSP